MREEQNKQKLLNEEGYKHDELKNSQLLSHHNWQYGKIKKAQKRSYFYELYIEAVEFEIPTRDAKQRHLAGNWKFSNSVGGEGVLNLQHRNENYSQSLTHLPNPMICQVLHKAMKKQK